MNASAIAPAAIASQKSGVAFGIFSMIRRYGCGMTAGVVVPVGGSGQRLCQRLPRASTCARSTATTTTAYEPVAGIERRRRSQMSVGAAVREVIFTVKAAPNTAPAAIAAAVPDMVASPSERSVSASVGPSPENLPAEEVERRRDRQEPDDEQPAERPPEPAADEEPADALV